MTKQTKRANQLLALARNSFDVIIIGGGVTGAGIALDAAARGLQVALIEKADFASGTSSKSTKLIHGGLRYLKQMDFALVRETGTERAVVHRLAPHLVIPEKMLLPLIEGGSYGRFLTSLGLKLYDILANVEGEDKRQMLDREETLIKEPLLKADNLKGGGYYAEYRTDDARLTIELIKKAESLGALCLNYMSFQSFIKEGEDVKGLVCLDTLTGDSLSCYGTKIVSAAGPWVDKIRTSDGSKTGKSLHLTKGIHIVVPHHKLPVRQTVYFDVPDGRMIFAIPRQDITYIGTTDTNYGESLDHIPVNAEDVRYLLSAVNATFAIEKLNVDDIVSSWAGLRPLIHEDGKSPSELSRKDEIFESPSGLISIAGGKLTGYRKMAKRVVDLLFDRLDMEDPGCTTDQVKLTVMPYSDHKAVMADIALLTKLLAEKGVDESANIARYLIRQYGKKGIEIASNLTVDTDDQEEVLLLAELTHGLTSESVHKVADFLVRRTGYLYFNLAKARKYTPTVAGYMKQYYGWDESRYQTELQEMHNLISEAVTFA